ncbi:putative integral membrane protein [Aspergillus candidus]|uniref:Putative integral membrane protein n=1 Tax=Aspergillus candidus TaxID=41067 RepID=A0A2I2F453_ASPCN|nr:putative integral membrane protein [Aspergillus candidus]PLB35405.1 putative integral membrane protein [Aspergillus candidus]
MNSRREAITIVTALFLALSCITVSLRCYVRLRLMRAFGWDDGIMVAALCLYIGFSVCIFVGSYYGVGEKTAWFVGKESHMQTSLLCWWLGQNFYIVSCVVAKISIIIALLRITIVRAHSIILYVAGALTVAVGLLFLFFSIFECHPVSYFWMRQPGQGSCLSVDTLLAIVYLYSSIAALTDFTIGLLPCFIILDLQMSARTKFALAGILGLGCIASSAVIVRIPFLSTYRDPDFLYATYQISIWSNVEAGLGITAGSLTTLRPLFRLCRERSARSSYPLSYMGASQKTRQGGRIYDATSDETHGVTTTIIGNPEVAIPWNTSEDRLTWENPGVLGVERSFRVQVENQ